MSIRPTPCAPASVSSVAIGSTNDSTTPLTFTGTPRWNSRSTDAAVSGHSAGGRVSLYIAGRRDLPRIHVIGAVNGTPQRLVSVDVDELATAPEMPCARSVLGNARASRARSRTGANIDSSGSSARTRLRIPARRRADWLRPCATGTRAFDPATRANGAPSDGRPSAVASVPPAPPVAPAFPRQAGRSRARELVARRSMTRCARTAPSPSARWRMSSSDCPDRGRPERHDLGPALLDEPGRPPTSPRLPE